MEPTHCSQGKTSFLIGGWYVLISVYQVFNGIGTSSFFTLGAGIVSDCFFLHERYAQLVETAIV